MQLHAVQGAAKKWLLVEQQCGARNRHGQGLFNHLVCKKRLMAKAWFQAVTH